MMPAFVYGIISDNRGGRNRNHKAVAADDGLAIACHVDAIATVDQSHAQLRIVQTAIRTSEFVQVTSGLKEGELVITSGGYALPDKTQIKIEAAAQKDPAAQSPADSEKDKE